MLLGKSLNTKNINQHSPSIYAALYYGSWMTQNLYMLVAILSAAAAYLVAAGRVEITSNPTQESTKGADVVIAALILACIAYLELLQLLVYWTSIWGRVSFVCQYVRRGSRMMRFKELLIKIGVYCASSKRYWQHKLGQYSLLDSASYNPNRLITIAEWLRKISSINPRLSVKPGLAPRLHREARKKPAVGLPAEVKEALVRSLVRSDGKLTNGESSLVSNGARHLSWACAQETSSSQDQENQAHLILTWHIATSYCEMARLRWQDPERTDLVQVDLCPNEPADLERHVQVDLCPNEPADLQRHVQVATKLSQYCAYLVVSAPRFLPGHPYDTSCVFDEVAEEAAQYLQDKGDKYDAMNKLTLPAEPTDETTIFHRGVKLGKQLEELEDVTLCWKVLADFWAELLLYVAPSDDVACHIESLAQGGELVTHLWALLSHAGILKREDHHRVDGSV